MQSMKDMKVETVKIEDIRPHPKNPRIHPESAMEKLVRSIKEFGWTNPVLISKDGYILAGHARVKAAERMGLTEVPAIRLPLTGAKADAYLVADNKLQDGTDWDLPILRDLLEGLDDGIFDVELTGFDLADIGSLVDDLNLSVTEEHEHKRAEYKDNSMDIGAQKDANWFYVTFYGQPERFAALQGILKQQNGLRTEHEIDAEFFERTVNNLVNEV